MTKNRLDNLNDHLFAQIERLCDEDLTPEQIEREARRGIVLASLADQTVRVAALQLQAARVLHDHDGRDPSGMLGRFIDQPATTRRTLTVVAK